MVALRVVPIVCDERSNARNADKKVKEEMANYTLSSAWVTSRAGQTSRKMKRKPTQAPHLLYSSMLSPRPAHATRANLDDAQVEKGRRVADGRRRDSTRKVAAANNAKRTPYHGTPTPVHRRPVLSQTRPPGASSKSGDVGSKVWCFTASAREG